jgi:hypothetical protein
VLQAYNYRVLEPQSGTMMAEAAYQPFRRHPVLVDWMGALETNWRATGVSFSLVARLPQVWVYQMDSSPGDGLMLSAFKVDQGQPLGLVLMGYGAYGDLSRLRAEHLWDDFLTMAASLQAAGPAPADETSANITPATATPAPTSTAYPLEVHQAYSSGLTVDEYALPGPPTLDPLDFTLQRWTLAEILARHGHDGGPYVRSNFGVDAQGGNMSTEWHGQTLTAREIYTNSTSGDVRVLVAKRMLFALPVGPGGPIDNLRELITYDGDWLLEAADVTFGTDPITHASLVTTTGQIVEDGLLLNARDGYQSAFGLQLLRGKPFYFYQQAGQIGIVCDGHAMPLGYHAVPHYGCCSGAELSPQQRENMVAFFAQKAGAWYYVEIGKYAP